MNRIKRLFLLLNIVSVMCQQYILVPIRAAESNYLFVVHVVSGTRDIADIPLRLTYAGSTIDAHTDASGKTTFAVPVAWHGNNVQVTTTSRAWQLPDHTLITVDNTDIIRLAVTRIPMIFVPGLLGSFINRNECSLWLGMSVSTLTSDNCSILPDKRALNDMTDPNVHAVDAVRVFQIEVPDYIYVAQVIEQITSIDILGLINIPLLKNLLGIPMTQDISPESRILNRAQLPNPADLIQVIERIMTDPNISIADILTALNVPSRKIVDENISYRRLFDALTTNGSVPLQEVVYPFTFKTPQERCLETHAYVAQNPDELRAKSTFYVFAYDWRQSSVKNADTLATFIDCVRGTHGGGKVNLVGHSLGGLVIQQYLRQNNASIVNRVATINTPYLGVVRMLDVNATGEFEPVMMLLQLTPAEMLTVTPLLFATTQGNEIAGKKTIAQIDAQYPEIGQAMRDRIREASRTWPSSKELFPTDDYLAHNGAFWWIDGNKVADNEQYWSEIAQQFQINVNPQERERMHLVGDDTIPDNVSRTANIDYLILYNSNPDSTITTATKSQAVWSYENAAGDGTVSELSLKRRSLWGDWNPKSIRDQRDVVLRGYCNKPMVIGGVTQPYKIDHAGIISHDDIAVQLNQFFAQEQVLNQSNECVDGFDYSIAGVIEHAADSWSAFKDWVSELWLTYLS